MATTFRINRITGGDRWGTLQLAEWAKIIWSRDVDMIVETSEVEEPAWNGDQWCNLHRLGWSDSRSRTGRCPSRKSIWQHQNKEWETTLHRSVNGASKTTTRPSQKRLGWILTEKEITRPEYKETTKLEAWGCLIQAEILESLNNPRGDREQDPRTSCRFTRGKREGK